MVSHVVVQTLPDPAFHLRPQSSETLAHYHKQSLNIQQQDDNIYSASSDIPMWEGLINLFGLL